MGRFDRSLGNNLDRLADPNLEQPQVRAMHHSNMHHSNMHHSNMHHNMYPAWAKAVTVFGT
jgi:hypothetical protein